MLQGGAVASMRLVAAASYDVLALGAATALAVFTPGRPFRVAYRSPQRTVDVPSHSGSTGSERRP
jgi:hypothetical protein